MIIKDKKYIFSNYITERRRRTEEDDDNGRGVPPGFEPDPVDPVDPVEPVDPPEGGGEGGGTEGTTPDQPETGNGGENDDEEDRSVPGFDVTGLEDRLDRLIDLMGDTGEQDFSTDIFRKFTTPEGREELMKPFNDMIKSAREGKGIPLFGQPAFKPEEELKRIERGFGKVRKTLAGRRAKGLDRKQDIGQPEPLMPETPGFRGSRGPQRGFGGGATAMNEQFRSPLSATTRRAPAGVDMDTGRAVYNQARNFRSPLIDPVPTDFPVDMESRAAARRIAQPGYQSRLAGADRDRIIGRVAAERGMNPNTLSTNMRMRSRGVQGSGPGGSYTSADRLNDLAGRVAAERGSLYNPDGSINFNSPEITGARETGNRMRGSSRSGYPSRFPGSMVGPAGRPASQERLDAMDARIAKADELRAKMARGEITPDDIMAQIEADGPSPEERAARRQAGEQRQQARADYEVSDAGREAVQNAIAAENASRARRGLPPMNARTERSFSRKVVSSNVSRGVAAASARKAEEERLSTAAQQGEDEYLDSVFPGGRDLPYAERQPEPSGSYDPNRPGGSVGGFEDTTRPPNTSSGQGGVQIGDDPGRADPIEDETTGNRRPTRPANDDPPAMRPAIAYARPSLTQDQADRLLGRTPSGSTQTRPRTMEYRIPLNQRINRALGRPPSERPNLATQFRSINRLT